MGILKFKNNDGTWESVETAGAVKYTKQFLTEDQKAQVRENISAQQNLFDPTSQLNTSQYVLRCDNVLVFLNNHLYSHPIPVQEGKTYLICGIKGIQADYAACLYTGVDLSTYVQGVDEIRETITTNGVLNLPVQKIVIPTGLNISYMRISLPISYLMTAMVVEGDIQPTKYIPYDLENIKQSPLYGKKIIFLGDSICNGLNGEVGYGELIAAKYNMQILNLAQGGATIARGVTDYVPEYTGDNPVRKTILDQLKDSNISNWLDADYIIFEGGFNDAPNLRDASGAVVAGTPRASLGTLSTTWKTAYGISQSENTFYGAMESMCYNLLKLFPNKKIGYISIPASAVRFDPFRVETDNFYLATKNSCARWGVPFCDLTTTTPPLYDTQWAEAGHPLLTIRNQYTLKSPATETGTPDGVHPTLEGYNIFYVPKIEAWLKTL